MKKAPTPAPKTLHFEMFLRRAYKAYLPTSPKAKIRSNPSPCQHLCPYTNLRQKFYANSHRLYRRRQEGYRSLGMNWSRQMARTYTPA